MLVRCLGIKAWNSSWLSSSHCLPLPWTRDGATYGFGPGDAWLPQPAGWARIAVGEQVGDPTSTLELYRAALHARRALQTEESLAWVETGREDVVHLTRPGGWHCVTNFGTEPYALPAGEVVVASAPVEDGRLPGESSAWFRG